MKRNNLPRKATQTKNGSRITDRSNNGGYTDGFRTFYVVSEEKAETNHGLLPTTATPKKDYVL